MNVHFYRLRSFWLAVLASTLLPDFAPAVSIRNIKPSPKVNLARIVRSDVIAEQQPELKQSLQVSVLVEDRGGSTDLSPTLQLWLAIYKKGEMFSTDAAFDLGRVFEVGAVRLAETGHLEISVVEPGESDRPASRILRIDWSAAAAGIREVSCGDELDCEASTNFRAAVEVERAAHD